MKTLYKIIIVSLITFNTYAQLSTEIDPKFLKLPRYADLAAISAAISTPTQGMQVFNIGTASNWYYNGAAWTNTSSSGSLSLPYSQTASNLNPVFEIKNNATVPEGTLPLTMAIKGEFNGSISGTPPFGVGSLAYGIYGLYNGGGSLIQKSSSGILGEGNTFASGVIGKANGSGDGVYGSSSVGIGGYFTSTAGPALMTGAGKVGIGLYPSTNTKFQVATNTGNGLVSETTEISANAIGVLARATQANNLPLPSPQYTAIGIKGEIVGSASAVASAVFGETFGGGTGVKGVSINGYGGFFSSNTSTAGFFTSTSGPAILTGTGNVGIGTASSPTAKLEVAGFTKLGEDATAPKIKMKEIPLFNTSGTINGSIPQALGVPGNKIISVSVFVNVSPDLLIPPVYSSDLRLNYNYFILHSDIYIVNKSTDCTSLGDHICGKPVKVLITYKE